MAASYDDLADLQQTYFGDEKQASYADDDDLFPKPCTKKGCNLLSHHKGKPFAAGTFRYAYRARYCKAAVKYGKKLNGKCVVKKWIKKHVFDKDCWKRDVKMSETAAKFVSSWNKLNKVKKSFIVLTPILTEDVTENTNPNNKDQIQKGEWVTNEDYLDGKFEKWNSNSGWINENFAKSSIQAFCHWTYHYTEGNFLFCDAQGL